LVEARHVFSLREKRKWKIEAGKWARAHQFLVSDFQFPIMPRVLQGNTAGNVRANALADARVLKTGRWAVGSWADWEVDHKLPICLSAHLTICLPAYIL
jgi:hypothetical protein